MKLYISAMNLPDIEPETIETQPLNELENITIIIDEQLSTIYWEVFAPYVQEEPVCGNIYDDLTSIASDLICGINEYKASRIRNAVFEWKFGLDNHWGNHIVDVLRILHTIRTQ